MNLFREMHECVCVCVIVHLVHMKIKMPPQNSMKNWMWQRKKTTWHTNKMYGVVHAWVTLLCSHILYAYAELNDRWDIVLTYWYRYWYDYDVVPFRTCTDNWCCNFVKELHVFQYSNPNALVRLCKMNQTFSEIHSERELDGDRYR